ncbi:MAG: molybdopterin-binding/glycosyltransferase family 2 protein [Paracoccaceae bacterium]|nr:molybdopterin-binding/glycosyltransferase family 2 protein [Paracoccaceae bacterium]
MRFGPVPVSQTEGAILAHSVGLPRGRLRKGARLTERDRLALEHAGIAEIVVAEPEPGDVGEDQAAAVVGKLLATDGLEVRAPFTGRVNIVAQVSGILEVDGPAVNAANAVDESVTVATLHNHSWVVPRQLVATIKIIPYFVSQLVLDRVSNGLVKRVRGPVLRIAEPVRMTASLILSRSEGTAERVVEKSERVVAGRLSALGIDLVSVEIVEHEAQAVAGAIRAASGDMILILGATATSDRADAAPAGLRQAGGLIERFGMPVDPGNLLFFGDCRGTPVIGLPGCARSPVLNGADWVLERVACGIDVSSGHIAAMGVGGLLKESSARPQPRIGKGSNAPGSRVQHVTGILLAAGASRRMGGRDKLLMEAGGEVLLRRSAQALTRSHLNTVIVVLSDCQSDRRRVVEDLPVQVVEILPEAAGEGMSASLRAGLMAAPDDTDGVLIALADMPDVSADHVNRLIAAFSPDDGRDVCRASAEDGTPGHPVLFGRRFFENLALLDGDKGARDLLRGASGFVVDVPTAGLAAIIDLDTAEDWVAWQSGTWR